MELATCFRTCIPASTGRLCESPTGCPGKNRDDGLEFNDKQQKNAVLAPASEAISLWWPITHHASTPGIPTRIPTTTGSSLRAPASEAIPLWRPITHHASTPGIPTRIPTTTGSSLRAPASEAISLWRAITHHASTPGIPTRIPTTTGSSLRVSHRVPRKKPG
jgi:hypothetical protein